MSVHSPALQVSLYQHHGRSIIIVRFVYDKALVNRFKQLPGARWSQTLKSWYVPDTAAYRQRFGLLQSTTNTTSNDLLLRQDVTSSISMAELPFSLHAGVLAQVKEQLILKGYSQNTRRTYLNEIAQLLKLIGNRPADSLQVADL